MKKKAQHNAKPIGAFSAIILAISLSVCSLSASAGVITLGEQDFSDGEIINALNVYSNAQAGEAAPFDGFNGSDPFGPNFLASWTFNPIVETVTAANITFGLYDGDSQTTANDQLGSFSVDGIDLTALLSPVFETTGGAQGEYNIYSIDLPMTVFAALSDGMAMFTLQLQGPTNNTVGDIFSSNGAGLDFSTLTTSGSQAVPEPESLALILLGIAGLGLRRKRNVG